MAPLLQTPLYDWHLAHQGKMVDFAGWSMPVMYSSIVEEHRATRAATGLFDISHMGRLRFDGSDSAAVLDRLLTRRVQGMGLGKIRYALITNEQGGILDDVLIYRLGAWNPSAGETRGPTTPTTKTPHASAEVFHYLVVNASNRSKIVDWISPHLSGTNVRLTDETRHTAMIAVQGPSAIRLVQPLFQVALDQFGYYNGAVAELTIIGGYGGIEGAAGSATCRSIVSRTGYTGEDGVEVIVPAAAARSVWEWLISAGGRAVGLGARDTLRLEAAMPLYGHELSEQINPIQAELQFAVNLEDREFVGRPALLDAKGRCIRRRVGLELIGKRVPREHYPVLRGDTVVGEVTSGTFSPTLQRPIAMAYVDAAAAVEGTELQVEIRGSREAAKVVRLPFYVRPR
jgi:aminomethyltransferase